MILHDEGTMSLSSASGTASPASSNPTLDDMTEIRAETARSKSVGERLEISRGGTRVSMTPRTVCQSAKTTREMQQSQSQSALLQRNKMYEEAEKLSEEKSKRVIQGSDDQRWRDSIRQQMEAELDQRVRDALETPPPERHKRQQSADGCKKNNNNNATKYSTDIESLNAHVLLDLSEKERAYLKSRRWKALQAKRQLQKYSNMSYAPPPTSSRIEVVFRDELSKSNQDEFPGVFGLNSFSEGVKDLNEIHRKQFEKYTPLRTLHKQYYTKEGFLTASRTGRFPDGTVLDRASEGSYEDKFGVVRDKHGPFWPSDWGPLYPAPKFLWKSNIPVEPLYYFFKNHNYPTVDSQLTQFVQKWRGVLIVYDSERSSRDHYPSPVPEGCCPNLLFESRFESGNLRQARRVGQFEYELVLKTDLYTNRHTQWYYFRVQNAVPGVTYKFRIVNLLKRDSLYNYGMRPLVYSDQDAKNKNVGWTRTGHHISYSRNVMHLHCPLLTRGIAFYELEWQMEFANENDTYYLAHCYPYTFTDLKDDLECLLNDKERQGHIQREVLCETRAGNSCFLVTVTNFDQDEEEQEQKKAVVITARVHPGESQASWMMKGVLDYVTGPSPEAQNLRNKFIFKIVPMLNPDGVIVGNYRCSLAARDLNRNYRHPRKESFPTVWHTKNMIENVLEKNEVVLYCDLHGHSRKHNVFMYGNNTATDDPDGNNNNNNNGASVNTRAFLFERLFPWLMAQKSPEKFSFPFCKFNIKRCKEATGRVVMWRQMRIHNSFTLEATFSGTAMNKDECRHFNISDYMDMGKTLCQSVLEFQHAQENKARQTEIVLEMTRYLACQVLERRNRNFRMPNLKAFMKSERANKPENTQEAPPQSSQEHHSVEEEPIQGHGGEDLDKILLATLETAVTQDERSGGKKTQRDRRQENGRTNNNVNNMNLSRSQVHNMIDAESMKTMDGCLKILAQLNVSEALEESDSSDSDSESEPELKPAPEPKIKKKKRKSKKQRDKEQQERKGGSGGSEKKDERKNSALPTISGNPALDNRSDGSSQKGQAPRIKLTDSQKLDARFVSKYEGRKNGGIPCFAEERSVERAAKRMAEMKKRSEEEKQRELAFFSANIGEYYQIDLPPSNHRLPSYDKCVDDAGVCSCGPPRLGAPVLRRSLTNDELQRRLQVALNEGTPNIAQTLVGFNVRTGYTHADSFRDLAPSVLPATAPANAQNQNSSSELSDSDENVTSNMLPMTARATPFQHDHSVTTVPPSTSFMQGNSGSMFKKHLSLRGPTMRSVNRHVSTSATPPLSYANHGLVRNEMMQTPNHTAHQSQTTNHTVGHQSQPEKRQEDRKRSTGPLNLSADTQIENSPKDKRTQSAWSRGVILF